MLPKMSKKVNLKGSGENFNQRRVSRHNHLRHKIFEMNSTFHVEIVHYIERSISVFQEFDDSINKIFIFAERLDFWVSFYAV